ncbi:uncharacterized protein BX663DRAFT_497557 [Cokeromyces recurvatus]|uniref:uncharacterized protein n=1 Tax=Cokeromyces recurvatus TaxID=90255 RepID=UPI00221F4EF5|nr:uncharacterized protein BX663DRAFT_497557 [Cokeromyces recurvatus]KAI7906778.1 hypothetical protein BX663DRAFT_497557 [Cokeromyces recurvatus]
MNNRRKSIDKSQVVENQAASTQHSEAPMAVLPLISSAKLDQEPNPFEQSFSGAAVIDDKEKLKLPPVASITSPSHLKNTTTTASAVTAAAATTTTTTDNMIGGGILPKEVANQFTWDTLRTGPLSPSMLQGPANPNEYYSSVMMPPNNTNKLYNTNNRTHLMNHTYPIKMEASSQEIFMHQQQQISSRKRSATSQTDDENHSIDSNESYKKLNTTSRRSSAMTQDSIDDDTKSMTTRSKRRSKSASKDDDDEKRKNFLERNRIAALKCRQRKKQWLNNLQAKVEFLTNDNERLQLQSESLKEEIVNLKTLLLAHKECPIAQSNGFHPNSIQKTATMPSILSAQQMIRQQQGNTAIPNTNSMLFSSSSTSFMDNNSTTRSNSSIVPNAPYHRSSITLPIQQASASTLSNQPGMVAGASSGVLRF